MIKIVDSIYGTSAARCVLRLEELSELLVGRARLTNLGDVPLGKVKFNSKMEYDYLDNFKVLQKAFHTHRIEKVSLERPIS